jgi:transcription elongation factor GreB
MTRWRPPQPPRSAYITAEGFDALQAEQKQLWLRRREVTQKVAEAAAQGDRSENADYTYNKKLLREIDRRIRFLQKRLPVLKVVRERPADPDRIYFGAWVVLETEDGAELACRIVGSDEVDPKRNWISVDSPMARALLKRTVDEEVTVRGPRGEQRYVILAVRYSPEGG